MAFSGERKYESLAVKRTADWVQSQLSRRALYEQSFTLEDSIRRDLQKLVQLCEPTKAVKNKAVKNKAVKSKTVSATKILDQMTEQELKKYVYTRFREKGK